MYMNLANYIRKRADFSIDTVSIGYQTITLFKPQELEAAQMGYRFDQDNNDLTGSNKGDWQNSWYVIGVEEITGDPIFIDLSVEYFPVYTVMHDMGEWDPDMLAPNIEKFIKALHLLNQLAEGREHPVALEKKPISLISKLFFLAKLRYVVGRTSLIFWWSSISDN